MGQTPVFCRTRHHLCLNLHEMAKNIRVGPTPHSVKWWRLNLLLAHLGLLKVGGKTLCEILTVANAMPLPMAGSRVDDNLPRHGSARLSPQRSHPEPVVWCLGSGTWLKNPAPMPAGVPITVQLYGKLEQTSCSNCFGQAWFRIPSCRIWRLRCLVEHLCVV